MKMLYILNVANRVNNFSRSSMEAAKSLGIEYHIAGNWSYKDDSDREADADKLGIHIHQIDFIRSPFDIRNYKAYKQLKILIDKEGFDVVHCNTPIGGLIGRMVFKGKKNIKIIYQAHGFHFYKGAPLKNWLLYYPVEKCLANYTDVLITINKEDFMVSKNKFRLRSGNSACYVPGVGIDLNKFSIDGDFDKSKKKKELGLPEDCTMLLSVGELSTRKNQEAIIRALPLINNDKVYYCIAGRGDKLEYLKDLAEKHGVINNVRFLGFRSDVSELCKCTDIYCFPSLQEGLPVALMEAMAEGLPCVVSRIRGNIDLIEDGKGGFLCSPKGAEEYAEKISILINDKELKTKMSEINRENIKEFSLDNVAKIMSEIYERYCFEKSEDN